MARAKKIFLSIKQEELILNKHNGMSVIEPMIALALFSIIITGIMTIIFSSQKITAESQTHLEAQVISASALENAETALRENWDSSLFPVSTNSIYQTSITAEEIDDYTKKLLSATSWIMEGKAESVKFTTLITDWKNALYASVCTPLSGNWENPQIISTIDTGPANPSTAVAVKSNLLYITADSAAQSKPDFFIFDISDNKNPQLLSSLNTGPGLSSIQIAGNYAYVGNTSINGQLEIINISNPAQPVLMKTYKLPGVYSDNTTITNTLIYSKTKIYLGTAKSQIAEFHIIDVSDPLIPQELGSFEINAGINALAIKNSAVFVASPANEEIKILDVSAPGAIRQIGGFDAPGGSGNGKSLSRFTSTLYLGRTVGGNELYSLNIENPNSPQILGSKILGTSINGLAVADNTGFLITNDTNKKLQIWSMNEPNNMNLKSTLSPAGTLTGIACQHNTLYITTSNPDGVVIVSSG
jgi:hypothetical protein